MKNIRVVIKEVDKPAEVKEISNDYKTFQQCVGGGLYEIVEMPGQENVDIACNEEYLLNGMRANLVLPECDNVLGGPLVFMGYDPETGESISLTDEQISSVQEFIEGHQVQNMSIPQAYYAMKASQQFKPDVVAE